MCGTSVETPGAGAAAVGRGQVRLQRERGENDAEKNPRPKPLVNDAGVIALPSHAGVARPHAFDQRAGVHVAWWPNILTSGFLAIVLCFSGVWYFRRTENSVADVI